MDQRITMQMNRIKISFIALLCALFCGVGYYYHHYYMQEKGPIYEFDPQRDTQPILALFDQNWHWLIANEGSSPAFYLKYKTPDTNPLYFGKLKIKVLRENNDLIGFVAYFMEYPDEWRLLFLAVDEKYRGKGYGTTLAQYAMSEMIKQGAKKIMLWTRLANPAQNIYKKLGFVESYYTESGFIFYEFYP